MTECLIEGCDRLVIARGYCQGHYRRWRLGKPMDPPLAKHVRGGTACTVEGCDRRDISGGLCKAHKWRADNQKNLQEPLRPYLRTDDLLTRLRAYAPEGAADECWEWTRCKGNGGEYGLISIENGKLRGAHIVAWELANNRRLPRGMCILHTCDNPPCTNPAHLRLGTQSENQLDKVAKGRHARGGTHGMAKLSEDDVREIRILYSTGDWGYRSLGKKFGVSYQTIAHIIKGLSWTHIR